MEPEESLEFARWLANLDGEIQQKVFSGNAGKLLRIGV
jgi:hypothetical protein